MSPTTSSRFDFELLTVSDVSRVYGRHRALSKVSLTLRMGEIVGLLGPNGAGKSTLLSVLATLTVPSAGSVRYGDVSAREGGPALRAQLGYLSHDLQLYPELTARENLEFFAELYGLEAPSRCGTEALVKARLTTRADDQVLGFSRGMRQRLALERVLLHQPRLVLLDEPFTGLDEMSSRALIERLRELKSDGRIVVLATHDLDLVQNLVDRVVILRNGQVVELATGDGSLKNRYREEMRLK
jgi:heme exporter protein A